MIIRLALALALLTLAGCGKSIDADEAHLCRLTLPALEPDGSRIVVTRVRPGAEPHSIFLRYRVERPGMRDLRHMAMCRFAPRTLPSGQPDLIALATQQGRLSGARLYLLKRYYLQTSEALANDPGRGEPESAED